MQKFAANRVNRVRFQVSRRLPTVCGSFCVAGVFARPSVRKLINYRFGIIVGIDIRAAGRIIRTLLVHGSGIVRNSRRLAMVVNNRNGLIRMAMDILFVSKKPHTYLCCHFVSSFCTAATAATVVSISI